MNQSLGLQLSQVRRLRAAPSITARLSSSRPQSVVKISDGLYALAGDSNWAAASLTTTEDQKSINLIQHSLCVCCSHRVPEASLTPTHKQWHTHWFMSDIFHLCDSGVISRASFWLWITSLNICTCVCLSFINSYVHAYSSSRCSPCVWMMIHQSVWHIHHHAATYITRPRVYVISLLCFIANKSSHNTPVHHDCDDSVSQLRLASNVLFQRCFLVFWGVFFRGNLHPCYCRGFSRGRRIVLLHCLQSLWLCQQHSPAHRHPRCVWMRMKNSTYI